MQVWKPFFANFDQVEMLTLCLGTCIVEFMSGFLNYFPWNFPNKNKKLIDFCSKAAIKAFSSGKFLK